MARKGCPEVARIVEATLKGLGAERLLGQRKTTLNPPSDASMPGAGPLQFETSVRSALAAYIGLPSPWAQCMRPARPSISVAASSRYEAPRNALLLVHSYDPFARKPGGRASQSEALPRARCIMAQPALPTSARHPSNSAWPQGRHNSAGARPPSALCGMTFHAAIQTPRISLRSSIVLTHVSSKSPRERFISSVGMIFPSS